MWFRNGILSLLALGGFLCPGQSNFSFNKVTLVGSGNAELVFLSGQKRVAIHCPSQTEISIPYDKIVRLSYWRSEKSQTGKKVAIGAVTWGLGALLVPKVSQYHLFIDYEGEGSTRQVELLLGDKDWGQILHVARLETGKEILTLGGAAPALAPPATAQSSPAVGQAQPAAAPAPAPSSGAALTITSTPPGADIQVNGAFSGNTPSTLKLDPGDYSIAVEKQGFASWQRSVSVTAPAALAWDAQLVASASSATAPASVPTPMAQIAPEPPVPAAAPTTPDLAGSAPSTAPHLVESPAAYLHPVKLGSQWGYVNLQGQFRFAPMADSAELFSEGRALIAVASHGTASIPVMRSGLPMAAKENRYGWIDESGRIVIPAESTLGGPFSEGLALSGRATGSTRATCTVFIGVLGGAPDATCVPESHVDFVDKSGNVVLHTDFVQGQKFSEKLAAVETTGPKPADTRWGYIDPTGKLAITASFLQAHPFADGLAAVKVAGKEWGFIDHTGAVVIQPEFTLVADFSGGLAAVQFPAPKHPTGKPSHEAYPREKRWGYIDRSGARVAGPGFVMAQPFFEGLAAVNTETMVVPEGDNPKRPHMVDHAQWSFIDGTGRIVIAGPFQAAVHFSGGLAPVKQDGLWGYIDTTGAFRIAPRFQAARIFRGDEAAVRLREKWGFIDRTGKFVVPPQFDDVK